MGYRGVIFDFNGTMFWDTHFHNKAWDLFLEKHYIILNEQEKNKYIHGKNNNEIFTTLFKRELNSAEIRKFINEKESFYRQICLKHEMELAPGLISLLDYLNEKKNKYTIATASGIENINFFFKHLPIGRWFSKDKIIYDDGNIKSKPDPGIFLKAVNLLNLQPFEVTVFEDSVSGIKAAENACIGKIIIVNSSNVDYSQWEYDKIRNFDEVDRKIFNPGY